MHEAATLRNVSVRVAGEEKSELRTPRCLSLSPSIPRHLTPCNGQGLMLSAQGVAVCGGTLS